MNRLGFALSSIILLFGCTSLVFSQATWQKYPSPVFPVWAGNYSDPSIYRNNYGSFVLFDSTSNLYKMWFSYQVWGSSTWSISYAISPDGINWFGYSKNPVLESGNLGSFDAIGVFTPFVIKVGNELRMYYTGYDGSTWQTGLATSVDGLSWTKYPGNPILAVRPGTWESIAVNDPKVFHDGTQFVMFYNGHLSLSQAEVGLATSSDGYAWERSPLNPVLRRGPSGSWDQYSVRSVGSFIGNGKYYLLYDQGGGLAIGFAHSVDGIVWTKHSGNPVFLPSSPVSWDDARVEFGSVVLQGSQLKFWYSGFGSTILGINAWQIGYATSDFTTSVSESPRDIPAAYRLSDAYPNPFNPETEIEYSVPTTTQVSIKVFDSLGKEVTTLVNEVKQPGIYTVRWMPNAHASGVYFYRMNAGSFSETKKVMLLK